MVRSRDRRRADARSYDDNLTPSFDRAARFAALIKEAIAAIFREDITDPRLTALEITSVEMSADGGNVRIRFLHPDRADAERALDKATAFVRARLAEHLPKKRALAVRFVYDRDRAQARAIVELSCE